MTVKTHINILIALLCFASCSETNPNNKFMCEGRTALMLQSTIVSDLKPMLISRNSEFINRVISMVESIEAVSDELIIRAGGINPETMLLGNGCRSGNDTRKLFVDRRLSEKLQLEMKKLKVDFPENQQIIEMIDYMLAKHFYATDPYFNEKRLTKIPIAILTSDLLAIQNGIYGLLLSQA
ncbi:hypothetical protein WJR50_33405 [Catalinimonas sp. 4WD22]|uniref:hypothetical protein n=1 Tax=Catalinimonas locisalis TaxID=3133978 RepID=UPI00310173DA